jgi:hypothetical protein
VAPRIVPAIEVLRVTPPPGSQFKGYEPYLVLDLECGPACRRDPGADVE